MIRVDYLVSPFERIAGFAMPELPAPLRRPLLALGASLIVVSSFSTLEELRLRAALADGDRFAQSAAAAAASAARVRALATDVERLRALTDRIDSMRASGASNADALAAIGNGVPRDAWLSAVRIDRGAYTLEGRTGRLGAVSATMSALGALRPFAGAKLLAVRREGTSDDVTYSIALEPRR